MKTNVIDRESIDLESDDPKVIKTKNLAMKPMSVREAIMQIELTGNDFLVFVNSGSSEVNVVYKRKDGNYEITEPFFE